MKRVLSNRAAAARHTMIGENLVETGVDDKGFPRMIEENERGKQQNRYRDEFRRNDSKRKRRQKMKRAKRMHKVKMKKKKRMPDAFELEQLYFDLTHRLEENLARG